MSLITEGLVNWLDAQYIQDTGGFTDGQNIVGAFLPDPVDSAGWYGSDGYDCTFKYNAVKYRPAIRFKTGVITPVNINKYLNYTNLTVIISAKRTGPAWNNTWMGLYSSWYNFNKTGATILAITDNANLRNFDKWGTYGGTVTTQSTSAMDLNTPYILSSVFTPPASGSFYTNSTQTGEFTLSKDQGYFGLGGLLPARGSFVGDIYEVLIYGKKLTEEQIQENSAYLISKWFNPCWGWANIPITPTCYTWTDAASAGFSWSNIPESFS